MRRWIHGHVWGAPRCFEEIIWRCSSLGDISHGRVRAEEIMKDGHWEEVVLELESLMIFVFVNLLGTILTRITRGAKSFTVLSLIFKIRSFL